MYRIVVDIIVGEEFNSFVKVAKSMEAIPIELAGLIELIGKYPAATLLGVEVQLDRDFLTSTYDDEGKRILN